MSPAAKIGLFILIGFIILGVFILKIEDIPLTERGERLQLEARIPSAAGIDRKAAVRIAGVRVGKVEEVRLDGSWAVLSLSLDADVRLHEGAGVVVTSMGMLGDKYVEVTPGNPTAPLLQSGVVLEGESRPSFDDVLEVADSIGRDVKEVTTALRASIGGQQGADRIDAIVDNLEQLTASLREMIEANQGNVNSTIVNFREFSQTLRDELPAIAEKMNRLADNLDGVVAENRDDLKGSLENIRDLSERLKTSADNLNTITGKVASGEGTIGKLVNDETTVDNFNETLDSIEGGVKSLQNTVGRFERFRLDMTMQTEALPGLEDSDGRSQFGFDLWTTDSRFFRVGAVDTPFGQTEEETVRTTTVFPDGSSETVITEKLTTEDNLGFNAQVGFLVRPDTTVRLGLIESAGGFGIDHDIDIGTTVPLRLTFEAYDFDRAFDLDPHLRLSGRYHVTPHLFVVAGWDDPLESDRSSLLIGGGVTWTDDDVKYLLGLAGSAIN